MWETNFVILNTTVNMEANSGYNKKKLGTYLSLLNISFAKSGSTISGSNLRFWDIIPRTSFVKYIKDSSLALHSSTLPSKRMSQQKAPLFSKIKFCGQLCQERTFHNKTFNLSNLWSTGNLVGCKFMAF